MAADKEERNKYEQKIKKELAFIEKHLQSLQGDLADWHDVVGCNSYNDSMSLYLKLQKRYCMLNAELHGWKTVFSDYPYPFDLK